MSYEFFKYLKFLFKSTNQHGVHSPFVYNLVTKCFYDKTKYQEYRTIHTCAAKKEITTKQAGLLYRLGRYFNSITVTYIPFNTVVKEIFARANPQIQEIEISETSSSNKLLDLIYLNTLDIPDFDVHVKLLFQNIHNDSLLLIQGIHQSKATQEYWNFLKNHPRVSVTIDTFHFGFIFFRKEQAKEHFVIRL